MRKPDPLRYCQVCHGRLTRRRRAGGSLEGLHDFLKRERCIDCSRGTRAPRPPIDRTALDHPERTCFGVDTNELYPQEGERNAPARIRYFAQAMCAGCPVLRECREIGDRGKEYGLWGGVLRMDGQVIDLLEQKEGAA